MSEIQVNTINEYTGANGVTIDGVLIKDGYVGNTVEVDQYLLPSDLSVDTDPITTFQRPTGTLQTHAGTGMTYTSGVFSFPKTGIWKVSIMARINPNSAGNSGFVRIQTSSNNGTDWDIVVAIRNEDEANRRSNDFGTTILDITDISNDKVKISFDEVNDADLEGATAAISTGVFFERLGDT
tara:strand:+ start:182 stop:727 length:546 start_codon:yes stop_codon:yes gene_type:complete